MGITYGDHLIDSGYYDITPEQEREIEAPEASSAILCQVPKCDRCGRFMRCEPGASYAMRYSGYPPGPDHEDFRCRPCTVVAGPLKASFGMAEWTAGTFRERA